MRKVQTILVIGFVVAILVVATHPGIALNPGKRSPFSPVEPMVVGANHIDCDLEDRTFKVTKVFVLHIPADILATLSPDQQTGFGKVACSNGCVASADPDAHPKDDGDISGSEVPTGAAQGGSVVNWPTPLDIDLNPLVPDPQHPGKQKRVDYWGPSGVGPVVIKIVLDNPNFQFFHPQTLATNPPTPTDWSHAVLQGDEGRGMFKCAGEPKPYKPNPKLSFITVRVFKLRPPVPGKPVYGGINVGILVPADKSNPNVFLPLYIDPQIHNNG